MRLPNASFCSGCLQERFLRRYQHAILWFEHRFTKVGRFRRRYIDPHFELVGSLLGAALKWLWGKLKWLWGMVWALLEVLNY